MQQLISEQKKKKSEKVKEESKSKTELKLKSISKEQLALNSLQKQMQVLKLKEYLVLAALTGGAVLLRKAMEPMPNVEPVMFFAVLAGWLFGRKKGLAVGASSAVLSNLIMFGGQGPWTIFQAIGWGAGGYLGGFLPKKARWYHVTGIMLLATLVYQLGMNISTPLFFPIGATLTILALAVPFIFAQFAGNFAMSFFMPSMKKFIEKKGGFDEKEISMELIKKIKSLQKINSKNNKTA